MKERLVGENPAMENERIYRLNTSMLQRSNKEMPQKVEGMRRTPSTEGKKKPPSVNWEVFKKSGNTYFHAGVHYHRLGKLDCCVRDGNR